MVKKTVEMEVEYPDCASCGEGIFDGEEFYEVNINLSRMTCHRGDGYTTSGISTGRNQPPLIFCEKCFLNDDAKQKVIEEIERLKRELVKLR